MNKLVLATTLVLIASSIFAASRAETSTQTKANLVSLANKLSNLGGVLQKPAKGKMAIISQQKEYTPEEVRHFIKIFSKQIQFPIEVIEDNAAFSLEKAAHIITENKLSVGIILASDKSLPISLVSIEDRWAMINTARLVEGHPDNKIKTKRLQREISRMIKAIFLNGATIKGEAAVKCASDLEKINADPIDGQQLFTILRSMPSYGLESPRLIPYSKACQEGWAPAPTNDIQKAIWNKAKEEKERGPVNGLKIKP